jgi:hypothetical protein
MVRPSDLIRPRHFESDFLAKSVPTLLAYPMISSTTVEVFAFGSRSTFTIPCAAVKTDFRGNESTVAPMVPPSTMMAAVDMLNEVRIEEELAIVKTRQFDHL